MGIVLVVIAILGCGVWSVVQAYKAENIEEGANKGLFYYFSYDANLERFIKNRKEKLDKAQAEYQKIVKNLEKAKQSGDLIQVTKNNIKKDDAKNDLDWAQYRYDNLNHFKNIFWWHCFGLMFLAVWFVVSGLGLAFTEDPFWGTAKIMLVVGGVITLLSLIFGLFVSWRSLLTLLLIICNILILIRRHYVLKVR